MKKLKTILSLFLIIAFSITIFTGCSKGKNNSTADSESDGVSPTNSPSGGSSSDDSQSSNDFNYSEGIDESGLWEGITAAEHVELAEYTGISIPKDIHTVSDESIQAEIDAILAEYATQENVTDRAVENGDTVNIDYVGSIDGVEFEGGSTNDTGEEVTIGITNYIDDFLEQLIGHTPGESFNIEVTFPEDYGNEELNNKDAVFAVKLNYIVESIIPELNDEFVTENLSTYYGWDTVEAMETEIKDRIQSTAVNNYIQEYLIQNIIVKSLPESLLEYQQAVMLQDFRDNADNYGMELEEFMSAFADAKSEEELYELYLEENTQSAELYLIMQAIGEDADISIADEDVAGFFKKYMGIEDYSSYKEYFGMPYLKLIVLNQEIADYLYDNAVMD